MITMSVSGTGDLPLSITPQVYVLDNHALHSLSQLYLTFEGHTTSAGIFSGCNPMYAIACIVFPIPMSSPNKHLPPDNSANLTPTYWNGYN